MLRFFSPTFPNYFASDVATLAAWLPERACATAAEQPDESDVDTELDIPDAVPAPARFGLAKFRAGGKALENVLKLVSRAVPRRTTKDILKCVRMEATTGGKVFLSATDCESYFTVELLGAEVLSAGVVFVDAKRFAATVKGEKGFVTITHGNPNIPEPESAVVIETASGSTSLPTGANPEEWVPRETFEEAAEKSYTFAAGELQEYIRSVVFAADRTDATARWSVCSVGFHGEAEGNALTIVATDTRRLAWCGNRVRGDLIRLVPRAFCESFLSAKLPNGCEVHIEFSAHHARLNGKGFDYVTRLVEGRFPPYADVVPRCPQIVATVNATMFAQSIRTAAKATDDEIQRVEMSFTGSRVEVAGRSESSEAKSDCPLISYSGEPLEIAFNARFVLEYLALCGKNETVRLEMSLPNNGGSKPLVMKGEHTVSSYLVMPLNG
jgi:DNA polymerase III subunit beta